MFKIGDREIKFRIWDQEEKSFCELSYPWIIINNNVVNAITGEIWRNIEPTQFICEKDKNEQEIYEGDIVKWKESLHDSKDVTRNDDILGIIEWSHGGFIVRQLTRGKWVNKLKCDGKEDLILEFETEFYSYDGSEFNWEELEVIGNKYQNTDLCKDMINENQYI